MYHGAWDIVTVIRILNIGIISTNTTTALQIVEGR